MALFAADPLPQSRWGHSFVTADHAGGHGSGDTILLFGGINAKNYCEGCVMYEFVLDPKQIASQFDDSSQKLKSIISKFKDTVGNQEGENKGD